ncbi:translation initiation factor IF-3 [Rickettsiales bacterium]|nr:translation initiation factor IF-3 [Rickettsiales bacterium]
MAYNSKSDKLPRANSDIEASEVRLVNQDGEMIGIVPISVALEKAREAGLDLVEISPNAEPPVCKILDFGRHKFAQQRKMHDQRKKQRVVHVKEIKLRPTIDEHDYQVKMRSVAKFLKAGDKVKFSLRFRGREIAHKEIGMELMDRVKADTEEIAKIEFDAKFEGRQIIMVIAPKS